MNPNEIHALRERAKELRCLYAIDAIVADRAQAPADVFRRVLDAIPSGWQRPESTGARIEYLSRDHRSPGFAPTGALLAQPLQLWNTPIGRIEVSDTCAGESDPIFLAEETELLRRIAGRVGEFLEWKHTELFGDRTPPAAVHWRWRQRFAESLADHIDPERFGVRRLFVGGSTALGEAGPGSDIDLYVLFDGTPDQRSALQLWLEGWSLCLAEVSLHQTGQPFPDGILNVHWLTAPPDPARRPDLRELTLG